MSAFYYVFEFNALTFARSMAIGILEDIRSPNVLLATASIRYLTYNKRDASIETLLGLLKTNNWKVRTVVIACLADLNSDKTINAISYYLNDENWWVRYSAAQALNRIGKPGVSHKNRPYMTTNRFNMDISQYVLNTF